MKVERWIGDLWPYSDDADSSTVESIFDTIEVDDIIVSINTFTFAEEHHAGESSSSIWTELTSGDGNIVVSSESSLNSFDNREDRSLSSVEDHSTDPIFVLSSEDTYRDEDSLDDIITGSSLCDSSEAEEHDQQTEDVPIPPGQDVDQQQDPQDSSTVDIDGSEDAEPHTQHHSGKRKLNDADSFKEECSICLSNIEDSEEVRHLPCSHKFHRTCIDKWLHSSMSCPLCRGDLRLPHTTESSSSDVDR